MRGISDAQAVAEGKIKCKCGNDSWQQFLYVETTPLMGACKFCGSTYGYVAGQWIEFRGPVTSRRDGL